MTAKNEVDASIIKDILISNGIQSTSSSNVNEWTTGDISWTVYCEEEKLISAKNILNEKGYIL